VKVKAAGILQNVSKTPLDAEQQFRHLLPDNRQQDNHQKQHRKIKKRKNVRAHPFALISIWFIG